MDTIILGTIALDNIETKSRKVKNSLGGSATYAAYAASFFVNPGIVSVIGEDFPKKHSSVLKEKNICLKGVKIKKKTFRWHGSYKKDINNAVTLKTELNALKNFKPFVPDEYKKAKYIFLGNVDPKIQLEVLDKIENPELVVLDTMNYWIKNKKTKLMKLIKKVDILLLNETEAKMLFKTDNLIKAGKKALTLGPSYIIIKKGEHGSSLLSKNNLFIAPSYPAEKVIDPTGAGDCFGGAFTGYLALKKEINEETIKKAIIYATAMASYNIEDFSLKRLKNILPQDLNRRFLFLRSLSNF